MLAFPGCPARCSPANDEQEQLGRAQGHTKAEKRTSAAWTTAPTPRVGAVDALVPKAAGKRSSYGSQPKHTAPPPATPPVSVLVGKAFMLTETFPELDCCAGLDLSKARPGTRVPLLRARPGTQVP